jgi:hypothetical protein
MAEHAIDPFASRQTTSSHYITFQLAVKRLTKTRRQKYSRKFSPPTIFLPVGELGLTRFGVSGRLITLPVFPQSTQGNGPTRAIRKAFCYWFSVSSVRGHD